MPDTALYCVDIGMTRKQLEGPETSVDAETFLAWNKAITQLVNTTDYREYPKYLVNAIDTLLHSEIGFIVIYGKDTKPINVYDNAVDSVRYQNIDSFFEGAYLLDPFYRAGIDGIKAGLYHLSEISPGGFKKSEYYKRFYESSMIGDEVGFIIHLQDDCFANVSLVKLTGSPGFSQQGIERTKLAFPLAQRLLGKYWRQKLHYEGHNTSQLHSQLESALNVFGSSVLTKRECNVAHMYLHGNNTKAIAERLFISEHTVSLHRKNLYAKLKVNSQTELFSLFIDSLSCVQGFSEVDPLELYLQRSNRLEQ